MPAAVAAASATELAAKNFLRVTSLSSHMIPPMPTGSSKAGLFRARTTYKYAEAQFEAKFPGYVQRLFAALA